MLSAALRSHIGPRVSTDFAFRENPPAEMLSTGIPEVDRRTGGVPRGGITEIYGPASSGRTSLVISLLAGATACEESCAFVDAADTFDPAAAASGGVDLTRLVWIRCGGTVGYALKAADLLIAGGGFGMVVMDMGDTPPREAHRISLVSWFRFRRTVEHTPTALVVIGRESYVSCASLNLEMHREGVNWSGVPGCSHLLRGARLRVEVCKPVRAAVAAFEAKTLAG